MPYRPVPRRVPDLAGRRTADAGLRRAARAAGRRPEPVDGDAGPAPCRIRAGLRPRRRAHRRRVRRRLAHRPWPARTRRPRGVPARCGPRRPPGRPRGPPAAGQPAPGRARRPARGAGRAGAGGAAQLRPLLVRGLPAAVDGPRGGAGPDGPARDGHGTAVRGARAGPWRRRGVAAQRQLGPRRAVVRRVPAAPRPARPVHHRGRTAAPGVAVPPVRGLPGGARLRGAGGRRRSGRLPDAGRAAARGRPGLPGRGPRPDRLRARGVVLRRDREAAVGPGPARRAHRRAARPGVPVVHPGRVGGDARRPDPGARERRPRQPSRQATQALADALAALIATAPQDWHMLQRVWTADLRGGR